MTMADIWLTPAARVALDELPPAQAEAVHDAISDIDSDPGQRIDLPGAPAAEPFLAKEPRDPAAPAVIYRRTATDETGDWLVVSLMNRDGYRAARQAEQELANYPAARNIVNAVVAGTVATAPTGATDSADDPADPYLASVREEVTEATEKYGPAPTGEQIFHGSPWSHIEASVWNDERVRMDLKAKVIAAIRAERARYEQSRKQRRQTA